MTINNYMYTVISGLRRRNVHKHCIWDTEETSPPCDYVHVYIVHTNVGISAKQMHTRVCVHSIIIQ